MYWSICLSVQIADDQWPTNKGHHKMTQALTKFEVARRQLVTAIRLFFGDEDSVSVYTLAHASWEILDTLCRQRRQPSVFGPDK